MRYNDSKLQISLFWRRNCDDHDVHEFLLLDLFSKLITVTLLSRSTIVIMITILAVTVTKIHPKKVVESGDKDSPLS